jgi:hypothetical protein
MPASSVRLNLVRRRRATPSSLAPCADGRQRRSAAPIARSVHRPACTESGRIDTHGGRSRHTAHGAGSRREGHARVRTRQGTRPRPSDWRAALSRGQHHPVQLRLRDEASSSRDTCPDPGKRLVSGDHGNRSSPNLLSSGLGEAKPRRLRGRPWLEALKQALDKLRPVFCR